MSNIRAITGSSKIVYRNQGGGSKKQGIPSSTNLNTTAHVAFRNRNVVCACNRHVVFCMNQLGGIGAGGVPGNSYAFAPGADGVNKNKILCGVNHKNIRNPKINNKKLILESGDYNILIDNVNNEYYLDTIYITVPDDSDVHLVNTPLNYITGNNIKNFIGKKYLFVDKNNKSLLLQIENTTNSKLNNYEVKIKILHNELLYYTNSAENFYIFNELYEIE